MGCDIICDLPDHLLTQILLCLPTKDYVKTSVLSTRWRNLWLRVPGLDLATSHFGSREVLVRFTDRFLEFNQGSCLHIMRHRDTFMPQKSYNIDQLMELIGTVVDHGIQHLDVSMCLRHRFVFMSQNIYNSKTLVSLKLGNIELKNPELVVSLPCLKIMKLFNICNGKDGPSIVQNLISGCPILEDLQLIKPFHILYQETVIFLIVRSQTLKRCLLRFGIMNRATEFTVEIDAPRLEYLSLVNCQSDRTVVRNLSSLLMIRLNFKYGSPFQQDDLRKGGDIFCDLLSKIPSVRHMIISGCTLEVFYCYSKLGPIPKFNNLYHLHAEYRSSKLQHLPAFLESCPNLNFFH